MYNPYDNANKPVNNENFQPNANNVQNQNTFYNQQNQNSYNTTVPTTAHNVETKEPTTAPNSSWSNTYHPPVTYAKHTQTKPKKKTGFLKKIIAVALICAISSLSTAGVMSVLIQNGTISVPTKASNSSQDLINDIVDDDNSKDNSTSSGNTDDINNLGTNPDGLKALSNKEIAEKVVPSVVCIQNYQVYSNNYWGMDTQAEIGLASEGSGVIISEDGYIISNAHVVDGATNIKVSMHDGTVYEAEIVGYDNATDISVIKIEADGLQPIDIGSSNELVMGDDAIAIGNPGGMEFQSSMTTGCISALDRKVDLQDYGYALNVIQTDAAISPGNSGGALVNRYGQLIGITSSKLVEDGYEGLGFALPIDDVMPIVEDLKGDGSIHNRAIIGISTQYIDAMTARFNGVDPGLYVVEVTSENAIASGLKKYDLIKSINGITVKNQDAVSSALLGKSPGDTVTLVVDRYETNETNIEIKVVLSSLEDLAQ